METVQWQEKIEQQLQVVRQWRQSGEKMAPWAATHGVDVKHLMGWAGNERRWMLRLAQPQTQPQLGPLTASAKASTPAAPQAKGFVAVRAGRPPVRGTTQNEAGLAASSVRIEYLSAGVVLHWPLDHGHELATWLKFMAAA